MVLVMLRVGVTGGIGSGKSTVARVFAGLGAHVIDADRIARQVLEPGTPGLTAVAEQFGAQLIGDCGELDRAALAAIVFADPARLAALEAITHPLIWAEADRQFAAVPAGEVAVHDMPLLVEKRMGAEYHLVVAVLVGAETRVRRLVAHRGLDAADARRRIAAQASDADRRAAAAVLLDNSGSPADLEGAAADLWQTRIAPFRDNLVAARPAADGDTARRLQDALGAAGVHRAGQRQRLAARVVRALGTGAHVGPPAGRESRQERRVELTGAATIDAVSVAERMVGAGFPPLPGLGQAAGYLTFGHSDPAWPATIALRPVA